MTRIAKRSTGDAERWPGFAERIASYAGILESVCSRPPVRPTGPLRDLAPYLGVGRRVRSLGRVRMADLFRVLPLPAYDLPEDTFEDEILKGALGALAVRGVFQGPRSPGTALVLLHQQLGSPSGLFGSRAVVRGGVGALVAALATTARDRGVEIRCGAEVAGIMVQDGRVSGVALEGGEEVGARAVLSGADPARTFLELVDSGELDPDFVHAVRQIRFRGGYARVHLALSEAPRFDGLADPPQGPFLIAPGLDAVERAYDDAKHGSVSAHPVLEARVPSFLDPSLCPPGRHVMSVDVRFLPVGETSAIGNGGSLEKLGDQVLEILARLSRELGTAVIIITHNLGVVARYADRVNVMYAGRIIESASAKEVYKNPRHPYTLGLLKSVPRLDQARKSKLDPIEGVPPGTWNIKIWYQTGWAEVPAASVTVVPKKAVDQSIDLPAKIKAAPAKGK